MKCMTEDKLDSKTLRFAGPCTNQAKGWRKEFRFGDKSKGEPPIVWFRYHMCAECLELYDEAKAEAAAEARMS